METYNKINNVIFRINYSQKLGLGNLIRCARIAESFQNKDIYFVIDKKIITKVIAEFLTNYKVISLHNSKQEFSNYVDDSRIFLKLPAITKKSIIFIDDARLDFKWQKKIKKKVKKIKFEFSLLANLFNLIVFFFIKKSSISKNNKYLPFAFKTPKFLAIPGPLFFFNLYILQFFKLFSLFKI